MKLGPVLSVKNDRRSKSVAKRRNNGINTITNTADEMEDNEVAFSNFCLGDLTMLL